MESLRKARILVVDDEEDICDILQFNLENEGYKVDVAYSAEEALKLQLQNYNLILLDVMMGQISGFRMARMMKENKDTAEVPIIFLTAKDTENDVLTGLTIGADDYISKPFSLKEVQLRVRAVLNRTLKIDDSVTDIIKYQTLVLDCKGKRARIDGEEITLTKKEFELLRLFMQNLDIVFSRDDILNKVWDDDTCVVTRTVDVNITRLRKKIGDYGKHIVTRLGYGYCFES